MIPAHIKIHDLTVPGKGVSPAADRLRAIRVGARDVPWVDVDIGVVHDAQGLPPARRGPLDGASPQRRLRGRKRELIGVDFRIGAKAHGGDAEQPRSPRAESHGAEGASCDGALPRDGALANVVVLNLHISVSQGRVGCRV